MSIQIIIELALAIATFILAVAAFKTINDNRKWNIIGKSPILDISLKKLDFMGSNLYQLIEISCKNIGFGPAYNVKLSCNQGSNRYKIEIPSQLTPSFNLNINKEIDLKCNLDPETSKEENREHPFVIETIAESVLKKQVRQKFELPLSTQGEYSPVILKSVDFGVKI